jgi:hypothetical protein
LKYSYKRIAEVTLLIQVQDNIHSVTHMTIARQRFGKHIPEVTQSTDEGLTLLGSKLVGTFLATDEIQIITDVQIEVVVPLRFAPSCEKS